MKRILAALVLAVILAVPALTADKPIKGKSFTVSYDPAAKGVLTDAQQITMVYAFDYWGTSAVQRMKGEEGSNSDLFQNVLYPDPDAAKKADMTRQGKRWKATITIPATAHLLSYYFTDGTKSDYNDKKTYVSYICNADGTPVRDARLQNVDFLLMAGKGEADVLNELKKETTGYPDNFIAQMVYWRFKFFSTAAPDTMEQLMKESDAYFAKLQKTFGDTVVNYQIRSLFDINRIMRLSMNDQSIEPAVAGLRRKVNTKILALIETIPDAKRITRLEQIRQAAESMLMNPDELKARQEKTMKEAEEAMKASIGKPVYDFSFTTLDGAQHRLSDFRGKYVLLDFWGTWCGPCVAEIPNLIKVHEKYSGKGLVMLSVSSDAMMKRSNREKLLEFTKAKGMAWMQVIDEASGPIHKEYKIQFWPNMFLIDPDGNLQQRDKLRGEDLEKTLSMLPLK